MKTIKKLTSVFVLFLLITTLSCSSDDENSTNEPNDCLKDSFELTETNVNDLTGTNSVIVTFDLKNNSSTDYSIQDGSRPINTTIIVNTDDGSEFETTNILTVNSLSAGATTTVDVLGNYGAGRTFSSYEISLSCR